MVDQRVHTAPGGATIIVHGMKGTVAKWLRLSPQRGEAAYQPATTNSFQTNLAFDIADVHKAVVGRLDTFLV